MEIDINLLRKHEYFDQIASAICRKPLQVNHEECLSTVGVNSPICSQYKQCKIWEKNEEQLNYILHSPETSSLLNACAGSGKTEVVGIKAAYIIKQWEKTYSGIAVLTFTNNAANVIKERVTQFVGVSGARYPHYIGTFDSWLHRYIANPFAHLLTGYKGKDGDRSLRVVQEDCNADWLNNFKSKTLYISKRLKLPIYANGICLDIEDKAFHIKVPSSESKEYKIDSEYFNSDSFQDYISDKTWLTLDYLRKGFLETKQKFWQAGFTTHLDVEYLCFKLLRNIQNASNQISKRFPIIIVDECQDLSATQLLILQELLNQNTKLHFVGDQNQSIFSFRKVDPDKVNQFAKNNRFSEYFLTNNFRSVQPIVDLCGNLVNQKIIMGRRYSGQHSPCLYVTYKELQDLPERFFVFVKNNFDKYGFVDFDPLKVVILARNNNMIAKLRPGTQENFSQNLLPAMAIHLWQLSQLNITYLEEALNCIGKFISSKYFSHYLFNKQNQYCPECFKSKIKWRMFLSIILTKCCANKSLSNLDLTWKEWAKIFRALFDNILNDSIKLFEESNTFNMITPSNFVAPKAASTVFETLGTKKDISPILRITNFHKIKGETSDAIMVVSSPTNKGHSDHWKNWVQPSNSENARLAYVASSRPSNLLVWAVSEPLKKEDITILESLGFTKADF
jgi:DNA helicase II / ATP-dependent DNA helicase PcrA